MHGSTLEEGFKRHSWAGSACQEHMLLGEGSLPASTQPSKCTTFQAEELHASKEVWF